MDLTCRILLKGVGQIGKGSLSGVKDFVKMREYSRLRKVLLVRNVKIRDVALSRRHSASGECQRRDGMGDEGRSLLYH